MDEQPKGRASHIFRFKANEIAERCKVRADYHQGRIIYWQAERERSAEKVRLTLGARLVEQDVSGGKRYQVIVDPGDQEALSRLNTAQSKIDHHQGQFSTYLRETRLYDTQGDREYELAPADVAYFHFGEEDPDGPAE